MKLQIKRATFDRMMEIELTETASGKVSQFALDDEEAFAFQHLLAAALELMDGTVMAVDMETDDAPYGSDNGKGGGN